MAKDSNILWTDHTINLWWGCSKVHTGCKNCYAEILNKEKFGDLIWGENVGRRRIKSAFKDLKKYQKQAKSENKKYKVFCGSMMDICEESKELINPIENCKNTDDLRKILFENISNNQYPDLVFLFLTKRPEKISEYVPVEWLDGSQKNVWFGTSLSNQETADIYTDRLVENSSMNLFLSIEPQIGDIDVDLTHINWVIQGGESGDNKRPFDVKWAKKMQKLCKKENVPYLFKQIDKVQKVPDNLNVTEFPIF